MMLFQGKDIVPFTAEDLDDLAKRVTTCLERIAKERLRFTKRIMEGVDMDEFEIEYLIETIVKALVTDKTKIDINIIDGEASRIVEVKVGDEDMGKVIGRKGRTADAIRTIVAAATALDKKRTIVQIVD